MLLFPTGNILWNMGAFSKESIHYPLPLLCSHMNDCICLFCPMALMTECRHPGDYTVPMCHVAFFTAPQDKCRGRPHSPSAHGAAWPWVHLKT